MTIDAGYLNNCIDTLEGVVKKLTDKSGKESYEIYRIACIKEFEIILEQSGRLLRQRISGYFAAKRRVDNLTFKSVFRHATKHGLIDLETCERWMEYRNNRNDTAHDYGEKFANETLKILPSFIKDARALAEIVAEVEE